MFGSRYGSYEVIFKALNYPPHTFDDSKIKEEKMIVDANDRTDAERIVEKTLKQQGRNFYRIYSVHLLKYKVKEKKDTAISTKSNNTNTSSENTYNPAVIKFLLILIAIAVGILLVFGVGSLILKGIFL